MTEERCKELMTEHDHNYLFYAAPTMKSSEHETMAHIDRVQDLLSEFARRLIERGRVHDQSKLREPEKEAFDRATSQLKGLTYGSAEYKKALLDLGPALAHHYANNSHHPEHYADGIYGMDLLDVVEMFMDWKAASERHADGDIRKSITLNATRFDYPPLLENIFLNTAIRLGWVGGGRMNRNER